MSKSPYPKPFPTAGNEGYHWQPESTLREMAAPSSTGWKAILTAIVLGLILLMALAGCSRKTTVPIAEPVAVHDTVYQNMVQHDSVYVDHFVEVSTKGDTVFKTQTEYIYREKQIHDTTLQVVNVPYTVVKTEYVEKNLTWVQKKLMHLGWVFIAVCVVVLVIWGVKLWRKFK